MPAAQHLTRAICVQDIKGLLDLLFLCTHSTSRQRLCPLPQGARTGPNDASQHWRQNRRALGTPHRTKGDMRPFTANLDVGIKSTTSTSQVTGGAVSVMTATLRISGSTTGGSYRRAVWITVEEMINQGSLAWVVAQPAGLG